MAIQTIGTVAAVPQQYEQLITSSTNWSVPLGVKTVEYLIAGGGANSAIRGGVAKGIYNVTGKTSIPIVIGAKSTGTGFTGSATSFDGTLFASGGRYTGEINMASGTFINLTRDVASNIASNYPIQSKTTFSTGTSAIFRYFAAENGRGIAIANGGTAAMTTVDSGATWTAVTSITGVNTTFVNILSEDKMLLSHNGSLWIVYQEDGAYYAYSTNGLNWVTVNFGTAIRDIQATGTSNQAVIVTASNHQYTSDITSSPWTTVLTDRGDVIFKGNTAGTLVWTFNAATATYKYSNNSGASFSTSANTGFSYSNVARWVKTVAHNDSTRGVLYQRGLNSNTFTMATRIYNNSNSQYNFQSYYVDSAGSGSTTSPNGTAGPATSGISVYVFRPQTFNPVDFGAVAVWNISGTTSVSYGDQGNYSFWNYGDGSLATNQFIQNYVGGKPIYNVSNYIIGPNPSNNRGIFGYSGVADGYIYKSMGYQGQGQTQGNYQNGYAQVPVDAAGNWMENSYNTTYPTNMRVHGGGIDGWGRNSGQLQNYGFGGADQNGAVQLRWWA